MIAVILWFAEHRQDHPYMLKHVYAYFHMSRQAFAQARKRYENMLRIEMVLRDIVVEVRSDHPKMGLRKIYRFMAPMPIGRDRFEQLMSDHRLQVRRTPPAWKTTLTQRLLYFPNLVAGLCVIRMHQVWVTDITYFKLAQRFAYIVVIQDVYTRQILVAVASLTLRAESNIKALNLALAATELQRKGIQTIHHSDRGSQYIDRDYLDLLAQAQMRPSMCMAAYENAYVERVIGTLKNEYLHHRGIRTIEHLVVELQRTVILYNSERPHRAHPKQMTPSEFAGYITGIPEEERPELKIYDSRQD